MAYRSQHHRNVEVTAELLGKPRRICEEHLGIASVLFVDESGVEIYFGAHPHTRVLRLFLEWEATEQGTKGVRHEELRCDTHMRKCLKEAFAEKWGRHKEPEYQRVTEAIEHTQGVIRISWKELKP